MGCTRVRKKCVWLLLLNVLFLLLASRGSCSFLSGLYLQGKSVSFALTLCCQSIVQFRVSWSAPAPVSALFRIIGNCAWNEQCWKGAFRFLVVTVVCSLVCLTAVLIRHILRMKLTSTEIISSALAIFCPPVFTLKVSFKICWHKNPLFLYLWKLCKYNKLSIL